LFTEPAQKLIEIGEQFVVGSLKKVSMTNPQADYDNPWKEALEQYFEAFLAFFFPQAHAEID
jgi:hypothetical protein